MSNKTLIPLPGQIPRPEGVYPLNGEQSLGAGSSFHTDAVESSQSAHRDAVFPDFRVWKHTPKDDAVMRSHLQKGYYEPPFVSNESHSGRQIITQLLHRGENTEGSVKAKLASLSDVMVKTMLKRREISKIKSKSTYKPPPRVTLTDNKRELWLKNLADPSVPLKQLARAIPYGLRNRFLLEQCVNHKVPIARTIWLIRCVSSNEQRQLKRKVQSSAVASQSSTVNKWIIEWTDQVSLYIEQIISSCFDKRFKDSWKYRLNYCIELTSNLYSEELLNRESLLAWTVHYLGKLIRKENMQLMDFRYCSIHIFFIRLFWFKIIAIDYLSKELSENSLFTLAKLHELPKATKTDHLVQNLTKNFEFLTKYLFYYNSDSFIIPSNWSYLKTSLKKIIDTNNASVSEQFKLITYRNESLMIDESKSSGGVPNSHCQKCFNLISHLDNIATNITHNNLVKLIFDDSADDDNEGSNSWKKLVNLTLKWAVTRYRGDEGKDKRILLVSSILRVRVQNIGHLKTKKYRQQRMELEMEIIEFVYEMTESLSFNEGEHSHYDLQQFLFLINELYSLNLFIMSSYLRRLIASGVIYLQEADRSCYIHLLILNSLPNLQDSNSRNILKRLSDSTSIKLTNAEDDATKEKLKTFLDSLFQPRQELLELQDVWTLSDEDPLTVGNRVRISQWFLEEFETSLKEKGELFNLNSHSLFLLYKLFEEELKKVPQFISCLVQHLNTRADGFSQETMSMLLKIISFNDELLTCCFPSEQNPDSNLYQVITEVLSLWVASNRFNITTVFRETYFNDAFLPTKLDFDIGPDPEHLAGFPMSLEELSQFGITSYERLLNAAEYSHFLNQTINQYWNLVKNYDDTEHQQSYDKLLRSLRSWKSSSFQNVLISHLKKFVVPTLSLDYDNSLRFVLKLVVENYIEIQAVLKLFSEINSKDEFSTKSGERLIWDLLFNDELNLYDIDAFSFSFQKKKYRTEHPKEYFQQLLTGFKMNNLLESKPSSTSHDVDMVNDGVNVDDVISSLHDLGSVQVAQTPPATFSGPSDNGGAGQLSRMNTAEPRKHRKFNGIVLNAIWHFVSAHSSLYHDMMYDCDVDKLQVQFLLLSILDIPTGKGVEGLNLISYTIQNLNYFNLPLSQLLFKSLVEGQLQNASYEEDTNGKVTDIILGVLTQLSQRNGDNHLVGELFEYIDSQSKQKILYSCEEIYLGSEGFPRLLVNNRNLASFLMDIISNCSRMKNTGHSMLVLSDSLVFSLNLSLEKLMYFCSSVEHKKYPLEMVKDLEKAAMLLSRIILIHKSFLAELILKRSVNLQRDVFLMNLTKLFNHHVMNKNYRLKNLLYDVLISLKIQISETSSQIQGSGHPTSLTPQQQPGLITSLSLSKGTPSSNSFVSPTNSPMPPPPSSGQFHPDRNSAPYVGGAVLNISPPNYNNKLKFMLNTKAFMSLRDTLPERDSRLYLIDETSGTGSDNLIKFNVKKFELIEDSNPNVGLNDCCISLQYFDSCIEKKNPR